MPLSSLAPTADTNRRLFGGTGYGWSPADEHARLTAQLARLDAEIARCDAEIARVRAERSAALLPLEGLAAVGQHIADIDADRAEQLARRNASNARVQRWAMESAKLPCTRCGTPTRRHETCAGCDAAALRARVVAALDAMPVGASVRFRSGFVARAIEGFTVGGDAPIVAGLDVEHCATLLGPEGASASTVFLAAVSS